MNRFEEIKQQYEIFQKLLMELEKEYAEKKKGDIYSKRKLQILSKMEGCKIKAKEVGTQGNVCWVQGKRVRPQIKNPNLMVTERFNLYFVNISEVEASALVKLHVKNVIQYTIKFIKPGVIINTS